MKKDADVNCFLFDIGNVLLNFDFNDLYALHSAHAEQPILPYSKADFILRDAVESGQISDAEWLLHLNQTRHLNWTMEDLRKAWSKIFSINSEGYALLEKARKDPQIKVYALSNVAPHHVEALQKRWPNFFEGMDGLFFSYDLGVRKPDPEIYRRMLDRLQVPASACFFIDDLLENVEAAKKQGIHAYQFVPENLPKIQQEAAKFFGWKVPSEN
jgi:putative hydrolase of the HAD superfamily